MGRGGDKFDAQCPAHQDRNPSLSVKVGNDDKVLVTCHAGCTFAEIAAALGMEEREFFAANEQRQRISPAPDREVQARRRQPRVG